MVPAATQVAAPPAEGETAPLIFETERELVVIAATLDKIFAHDPRSDHFADLSDLASATVSGARRAFADATLDSTGSSSTRRPSTTASTSAWMTCSPAAI